MKDQETKTDVKDARKKALANRKMGSVEPKQSCRPERFRQIGCRLFPTFSVHRFTSICLPLREIATRRFHIAVHYRAPLMRLTFDLGLGGKLRRSTIRDAAGSRPFVCLGLGTFSFSHQAKSPCGERWP